ncbi:conserved hypothetical protein [Theileria orientalis strain Shintoku]|uniref:Uncharacterized protein n=1 Tax=Theileria orientalis strain Shintoku TaxID=869250 RepID=J4D7I7_THEOR|nr:conserved hypothetical protein [Theileria orientalis strain Shintoku]BAM40210.1 conserved hypothetical protein [Theileria orientalis strain Shintoku]|eukprot:XP_009690511.1 conserved hypothetical protein [Theileria orientalis strain Shintoku]
MDGYRSTKSIPKTQSQNPAKPSNFSPINDSSLNPPPLQSPSKSHSSQSSLTGSAKLQGSSTPSTSLKHSTGPGSSKAKFEDRERRRTPSSKGGDDKTVKNPDLLKPDKKVDNTDLIDGLALQRQWDEKPDIDHLSNSLMTLYYKLESNKLREESNELREKIFLSALRVRSKSVIYLNYTRDRLQSILRFCRSLNLKYKTLNHNVSKIEKSYYGKCRKFQKRRSLNEVYDKLSRVVAKLPNMRQIHLISKELMNKMSRINAKIEKIRTQMESRRSHIFNATQLLSNITANSTTQ